MKRKVFLLLAVVAVAGLAASCGGDDDGDYDFAGHWALTATVTATNLPAFPLGSTFVDTLHITQDGNNLTATIDSIGPLLVMGGSCDPNARTFSVSGVGTGSIAGIAAKIDGTGVDDDSMSGVLRFDFGGRYAVMNWTANLSSRVAQKAGAGGGMKDAVLKALQ